MTSLNFQIAPAVQATEAPPIPKAQAWGCQYMPSPSAPLLDLSQGVPRDAPHPSILAALSQAASDPKTARYGPILGEPGLRQALAQEIKVQYFLLGQEVTSEDVAITTGCNMAFLSLLMTLCPPGKSTVLLPLPAYFNHTMSLSLQDVNPVYVPCEPDNMFKASLPFAKSYLASLKKESGDRREPRMIVLVSPSNPTGTVYTSDEIKLWDFVEGESGERGLPHRLFEEPDWRSTLVSLGSFSKGYRIPGHRLGSIIASPELLSHITTICDCMQICPPRPPQIALTPLLPSLRPDLLAASSQLSYRRHLFKTTVNSVSGWKVISSGGFFAYVQFPEDYIYASSILGLKRKKLGSEDVARVLALRCGVVTLPGSFFMPFVADDEQWDNILDCETLRQDKWLRFAVANVEDDVVLSLGPRLKLMNKIMGVENEDVTQ
ncbi:arylformamidase [Cryptococcus deuterogattii 99/473]|uniref:Arylformamidase n=1 Tax=Cryptococcus deuterogattii Ram5 TaxID=1296110 RepID=A0A0D0V0V4_9TREE|nr:arylformamidase [Cryptococcus deuterogattii LA55]KIR40084.1 arylformamidase [Cryptococcus deuterogattii Ram5]KIR71478.1 arylformamidase [Cryptococcus deuterogattii CA1014]KIR91058.1 arylformamidase [Cryptococcus deuterogattii CBS 10090]KIR96479.1 arylformamidase [Cryptococcus deuterogattii 2001/935-1]KIY55877.1 arylformamidase [Cryptococcus deuterogattii 99/473]